MSAFAKAWRGRFESLLSWDEFDKFWAKLGAKFASDWYIYVPGQDLPDKTSNIKKTREFLLKISELLHQEHQERYCGIVYVDNKQNPEFIKIYDPSNLGTVCRYGDNPPLPGWVLSKIAPVNIDYFNVVNIIPANRQRWWQEIFPNDD